MTKQKFLFWCGVFAMSLLVMVQPAQASGTVLLSSDWTPNSGNYPGTHFSSQSLACASMNDATHTYFSGGGSNPAAGLNGENCRMFYNGVYAAISGSIHQIAGSCPANSTGTTTCTCTNPYIPNAGATACVMPACPANGTIKTSGYYDIGTDPNAGNGLPVTSGCDSGCRTGYIGASVAWRVQVGGIYHYYAKGSYAYTGESCTTGAASVASSASVPAATCGAGQSLVVGDGGFARCYSDTGVLVDSNSASAVAAAKTLSDSTIAAQIAAAGSAVAAAGGSASAVESAQAVAAGMAAAGGSFAAANSDPVMQTFCEQNPTSSICVNEELGAPPAPETLTKETPSFSVSNVAFSTVAGCPASQSFTIVGLPFISKSYSISWQPFCDMAGYLRPIFLTLAAVTAAFIFAGVTI